MIKEIRINNKSTIYWLIDNEKEEYYVRITYFNRDIYCKRLDRKHFKIYHEFINERAKYLINEDILNKSYTMILLDNTMYKVMDDDIYFRDLMRILIPVDAMEYEIINTDSIFDLLLDTTLRTGEVFSDTDLVYHNGVFYHNGNKLKDIHDFDRVGIEYNKFDLLQGITKEQLDYLVSDYYSKDFKNYVTSEVNINIDKWY